MKNGQIWQDIEGNDIQAHGGCIINHDGIYYWYGEHKGVDNRPGTREVDMIGVSCYSSEDLSSWKYEGLVLEAEKEDPDGMLHPSCVLERPKVVYNKKNDNFVLWFHYDSPNRKFAGVGIAVSDTPTGKFRLLGIKRPNGRDSRDMTVYIDDDGTGYLFSSSDANATMLVSRLNEDYTDVDGFFVSTLIDQYREAPAILKKNGKYYSITSGCTGWAPNTALVAESKFPMGKWLLTHDPCRGENAHITFFGQSTYIFGDKGKYYLMLDHWHSKDLKTSGYSILPIEFTENGTLTVPWSDEFLGI